MTKAYDNSLLARNISISGVNTSVSGLLSVTSGNFINSLQLNGTGVSISGHSHIIGDVTGLQTALDNKQASGSYAASSHTHTASQVIDFNSSVSGLITGYALLSSPSLTGTPLSPTAAVDTNTTQIASTAFVLGQAASATPLIDGTAAVGTSTRYSRADHVHPVDTSRAALSGATFTGLISGPSGNFTQSLQVNGTGVSISGHTHTSSEIRDSTTAGRALLTGTDASAQRTSLGLGTLATQNGTFSGTSSGTNTGDQSISISGDVTAAGSSSSLNATVTRINGVALSGLSTGLLKNTTSTGAPSIAVAGTDYAAASHTHTALNITDFNSSVSGLLPVKNIIAGTNITLTSASGSFTINSTASGSGAVSLHASTHSSGGSDPISISTAQLLDGFVYDCGAYTAIVPAAPTGISGTPGVGTVALLWTAPTNTGGAALTDYIVQFSTDQSNWTTFADGTSTATTATVTGLTGGTNYYFRVAAVNSAGTGAYGTSTAIAVASSKLTVSRGSGGASTFTGAGTAASPYTRATRVLNNNADGLMASGGGITSGTYTFTAIASGTAYVTCSFFDDGNSGAAGYIRKNGVQQGAYIADGATVTARAITVATGDVITFWSDNYVTSYSNVSVWAV